MSMLLIIVVGQILIVTFGGSVTKTVPLHIKEWAGCVATGLFSIPFGYMVMCLPCGRSSKEERDRVNQVESSSKNRVVSGSTSTPNVEEVEMTPREMLERHTSSRRKLEADSLASPSRDQLLSSTAPESPQP